MNVSAIHLRTALICSSLVAALGCITQTTGLLYPGDELRENLPGYGFMVIGAEPSIRLYTLEVCSEGSCLVIGPFMQAQEAYLIRLPVGENCLTEVSVESIGSISGGGSGMGHTWRSESQCFPVSEGGMIYVGSFALGDERLAVVHRSDILALLQQHYPGLQPQAIDETLLD
jgi:hypothetical protein